MSIFKPLYHCDMIDQCENYKRTGKCINHGKFCFKAKTEATKSPAPSRQAEFDLLGAIPCLKQRQDDTRGQLQDLYHVANKLGLCDAADALKANFGI